MERMIFNTLLRTLLFILTILTVQLYFTNWFRKSLISKNKIKEDSFLSKNLFYFILLFDLFPLSGFAISIYNIFVPEEVIKFPKSFIVDYLIRFPSWMVNVLIVQIVLIFFPVHLVVTLFKKMKLKFINDVYKFLPRLFFYLVIFFLAYLPLRIYYESKTIEVVERTYFIDSTKIDLNNFKIAFISDIQVDRFNNERRVKSYINKVNEINPDIVLAGGDFVSGDSEYIPIVAKLVGLLKSNYGVYSCIGDHDFYAFEKQYWKSLARVKEELSKYNVHMIDNGNLIFNINNAKVKITFLSNTYVKDFDKSIFDSLASSHKDADFKILVTHQPSKEIIEKSKKYNYNLYLAGHTHGGQVNFLFPFTYLTPVMFETKYIRGDFWFDGMLMVVNRGLGMSSVPFRYHSIPEISLIILKSKK